MNWIIIIKDWIVSHTINFNESSIRDNGGEWNK